MKTRLTYQKTNHHCVAIFVSSATMLSDENYEHEPEIKIVTPKDNQLCGDFCLKQIQGQWSELSRRTIEERLLQKNDRLRRRQGSELRHRKWKSFARTTTHRRLRDAPMFGLSIESNTDWT